MEVLDRTNKEYSRAQLVQVKKSSRRVGCNERRRQKQLQECVSLELDLLMATEATIAVCVCVYARWLDALCAPGGEKMNHWPSYYRFDCSRS